MKTSNLPQCAFLLSMLLLCTSALMHAQQTASSTSGIHPDQYDVTIQEDELERGLHLSYRSEPVAKVQEPAKPVQNKYISTEDLLKLHSPAVFEKQATPVEAEFARMRAAINSQTEKEQQSKDVKLASSNIPNW